MNASRHIGTHAKSVRAKQDPDSTLLQAINASSQTFLSTLRSAVDNAIMSEETAAIHLGIYQENVFGMSQVQNTKNYALPIIPSSEQEFRSKFVNADGISNALAAAEFDRVRERSQHLPNGELSVEAKQKGKVHTAVIEAYVSAEIAFNKVMFNTVPKGRA